MSHSSISSPLSGIRYNSMSTHYDEGLSNSLVSSPNDILCLAANNGRLIRDVLDGQSPHLSLEICDAIDSSNNSVHAFPYTPNYEKCDGLSSTFEDSYPCQSSGDFSLLEDNKSKLSKESKSSTTLDSKLLGFSGPILRAAIFDDAGQTWPIMSAELYGMFFVAEDVFGEGNARCDELTCYRRNLFQISGAMILSRGMNGIINEQGQHIPIYSLEATLTAFESIEGKNAEIISVPWKTTNYVTGEDRAGTGPPSIHLDLSANPELDPSNASIPISWKRLQFKHATANNGRRKGLQQHYIVQVNLTATLGNGENFKLAEIQSGPIIVRGRSPRNFDSRNKDTKVSKSTEPSTPTHPIDHDSGSNNYLFVDSKDYLQPSPYVLECKYNHENSPTDPRPVKKKILSYCSGSSNHPVVSNTSWALDSPTGSRFSMSSPMDISLGEDEHNQIRTLSNSNGTRIGISKSPVIERIKRGLRFNSLVENTDFLYEYFPLSVDDWIPPVDAIYRPHIVHHTMIPEDVRAEQNLNKRKRYFSAYD